MGLPPALPSGTVVGGHYIVGNLVNSGGFGVVYRAVDTSEGNRVCALKEIYNVTPAARRQALMEASVLFTVRSRHLPEVYDALEANGRFYLVMELIEGQNLLQLLRARVPGGIIGSQQPYQSRSGPCGEQEVLDWLLPITEVLQELHSRSHPILHRDIKPGNIIIRPDQTSVLVDFGLTRLYDPQRDTGTLARAVTEGFSPPEQYMGRTMPQSDIYSLAATMYLLLTNCLPPMALQRSVNDLLIPPRQLNPALSPKLEHALLTALSVQAGLRYQSMHEFGTALQAPNFSGYSDRTIAAPLPITSTQPSIPYSQTTGTQPALPQQKALRLPAPATSQQSPLHSPPSSAPTVSQPGTVYPTAYNGNNTAYGPPSQAHPAYAGGYSPAGANNPPPGYPYYQPGLPPGYVAVPRSAMAPVQPRPTPSGQGCLWGIVHGLLAGLLVALTFEQSNFYLAIIMGLGFYTLAGFMTTRKGGGALRGGWAGLWAGIISTIFFWITYGICYLVLLLQAVQRFTAEHVRADMIWKRARDAVQTALPPNTSTPSGREGLINLVILCGIGLGAAFILGVIGGFLGSARYKAWWERKMAEPPMQAQQQRMRP